MPKNTKKSSKSSNKLLSKLANLSKRARLLIVIFSFILIGGIYFTYKSFADIREGGIASTQFVFDDKKFPYGAEELEFTIKPLIQDHPDGVFFANQLWFKASSNTKTLSGNQAGYAGLQTSYGTTTKKKNVVFSIWKAKSGVTTMTDSTNRSFGHEGSGWQIYAPYEWNQNNEYRFKIRYSGTNSNGDDAWVASIINLSSGQKTPTLIGIIYVPGQWWGLDSSTAAFSEIFSSPSSRTCDNIPYIGVEFKALTLKTGNTIAPPTNQIMRYSEHGREICNYRTRISQIQYGVRHEMSSRIYNTDFRERNNYILK